MWDKIYEMIYIVKYVIEKNQSKREKESLLQQNSRFILRHDFKKPLYNHRRIKYR